MPRHLVRHVLYTHVAASYLAAIAAAAIYSGGHVMIFTEDAFPLFLAPLVLPVAMMIENQRQFFICATIYAATFCTVLFYLRRRQSRWDSQTQGVFAAARAQPFEVEPLTYYSPPPPIDESYGVIELIAAGAAVASVLAIVVCVGLEVSRENSGRKSLGHWVFGLLLLPASTAMIFRLHCLFENKVAHNTQKSRDDWIGRRDRARFLPDLSALLCGRGH